MKSIIFNISIFLIFCSSAGATLVPDTKVTVTANGINKTLARAITDGDIGSGSSVPTAEFRFDLANGYGAVNTKIMRYTTTTINNGGTDLTYTDSANSGMLVTVNTTGIYCITAQADFNVPGNVGASVNSTQLTTNIYQITFADQICNNTTSASGNINGCTRCVHLTAGDLVRAHGDGAGGGSTNRAFFSITRLR